MIQARLDKLDKEKEELSQYYSLDKERRSLHHALLSQKVRGFNKEIADIDKERGDLRLDSGQTDEEQHVIEYFEGKWLTFSRLFWRIVKVSNENLSLFQSDLKC